MGEARALCTITLLVLAGCGGGGGEGPSPQPPSAPTAMSALPANGQAVVSWAAAPNATSYNVYTSATSPVTKAASRTNVGATSTSLAGLMNGSPVYVAVAAVNSAGESPLSSETCAVPTAANTAALTLHDALCAGTLDAAKWRDPLFSRSIVNGTLVLSTEATNMGSQTAQGLAYVTLATVNPAGQRVTTLRADIKVPASTKSRDGAAEILAGLMFQYQPLPVRLGPTDVGTSEDVVRVHVGLLDNGNGLRAFRRLQHCDNAACAVPTTTGVAFADPAGLDSNGEIAASYDTTYTVHLSLNETTGIFTWSVTGGTLGVGLNGSMDPTTYLAGNANWIAIGPNPLASNNGFSIAAMRTRALDLSAAGGSNGKIAAEFDNVMVGLNNAPAVLWDDFAGATELNAAKWLSAGRHSIASDHGALTRRSALTSASSADPFLVDIIRLSDPSGINTVQADVTVTDCANGAATGSNRAAVELALYNDGSGGAAPNANVPHSVVGDIRASLYLDCVAQVARFQILRGVTNTPLFLTILSETTNDQVPMAAAPIVGSTHTLNVKWDAVARRVTFQVDGQTPIVVDPTTVNARMRIAAPVVKSANAPVARITEVLSIPSAAGSTATLDFRVNNVFIAR